MLNHLEGRGQRVHRGAPESAAEMEGTLKAIEAVVSECWSPNTWAGYGSTWVGFQYYRRNLPPGLSLEIQHLCYVTACMRDSVDPETGKPVKGVLARTAILYSKRIASVLHTQGIHCGPITRMFRRGLRRAAALEPVDQAPPATKEEVLATRARLAWDESGQILLLWKTAARHSDFQEVTMDSLIELGADGDMWAWSLRTDMHKGDPFGEGTGLEFVVTGAEHELLRRWKASRLPKEKLLPMTYQRLMAILKETNPEFSEHSLKRGALICMMNSGVDKETLRVLAKHDDLRQLLTYLPVAAAMQHFYQTREATRGL